MSDADRETRSRKGRVGRSLGRGALRAVDGVCLALAILLLGVFLFRGPLVERGAGLALSRLGVAGEIGVERLTLNGAALRDIEIGRDEGGRPAILATALELDYGPDILWRGRIRGARLIGARIRAVHDGTRLSFPGLEALYEGEGEGGDPLASLAHAPIIRIEDAALIVETPEGPAELALDAVIARLSDGAAEARFTFAGAGRDARAQGAGALRVARDLAVAGAIRIDDGAVPPALASGVAISGLTGRAEFEIADGALRRFEAAGNGALAAPDLPRLAARGDIALNARGLRLDLAARDASGGFEASLSGGGPGAPDAPGEVALSGRLRADDLAPFAPFLARFAGSAAPREGAFEAGLAARAPAAAVARARQGVIDLASLEGAEATLAVNAHGLAAPDLPLREAQGVATARIADGAVLAAIPSLIASGPDGLSVGLAPRGAAKAAGAAFRPDGEHVAARLDGALEIAGAGAPPARFDLVGEAMIDSARGRLASWRLERLEGRVGAYAREGLVFELPSLRVSGEGGPGEGGMGEARGRLALSGVARGRFAEGSTVEAGAVAFDGRYALSGDLLSLYAPDCFDVRARRLITPGFDVRPGPARACPTKAGAPVAVLRLVGPARAIASARFALALRPFSIALAPTGGRAAFDGTTPRLELLGELDGPTGELNVGIAGRGGRLIDKGRQIALSDLRFAADADISPRAAPRMTLRLSAGRLTDRAALKRFGALALAGKATLSSGQARFSASVATAAGARLATAQGRHDLTSGRGRAQVSTGRLAFKSGGLQPQDVMAPLRALVTGVDGIIDVTADADWRPGRVVTKGRLALAGLGFDAFFAEVAGLNGELRFTSLTPPATAPDQTLKIGLIDAGAPLENGEMRFTLHPDGGLSIAAARWPWMGGTLAIEDGRIDLGAGESALKLRAQGLDLAKIFRFLNVDGLDGEGVVDGEIPVIIADGDAFIRGGRLTAREGGGIFAYEHGETVAGGAGEDSPQGIAAQALERFEYDALTIGIDGRLSDVLTLTAQLKGRNPALLDGYPLELNLTLEGALGRIARSGVRGYQLPERLQERLGERLLKEGAQ